MAGQDSHLAVTTTVERREARSTEERSRELTPPEWVSESPLLTEAFSLAANAHGSDRRPSDGRLFLEHVTEVAGLLQRLAYDEELVAVGLLHDSVERGRLTEPELRAAMGEAVCEQVMLLSENPAVEPFADRKAALREQVAAAGGRAVTVFAADKLSDIVGLRRGIEAVRDERELGIGTSVTGMASHYRESVQMIASVRPGSAFVSALRRELRLLEAAA